jgi:ribosomal protein L15E
MGFTKCVSSSNSDTQVAVSTNGTFFRTETRLRLIYKERDRFIFVIKKEIERGKKKEISKTIKMKDLSIGL